MGLVILWLENCAVSLLLLAWVAACVGRWKWGWRRLAVWISASLCVLLVYVYLAVFVGRFHLLVPWPFYFALSLTIAALVGMTALGVVGLKRLPETVAPTVAGMWPRGKLFAVLSVVAALHLFTIENLDEAADQQLAAIASQTAAQMPVIATPTIPESANAAVLYEHADSVYSGFNPFFNDQEQYDWMLRVLHNFDGKDPAVNRFMIEKGPVVRLLREGAKRPVCVVNSGSLPNESPELDLNNLGYLPLVLAIHSRWSLAKGDRRTAFQDVDALFRFAKHLSETLYPGWAAQSEPHAVETLQCLFSAFRATSEELKIVDIDEFWSLRKAYLRAWPRMRLRAHWDLYLWGSRKQSVEHWVRPLWLSSISPSLGEMSNSAWYRIFLLQSDLLDVDRLYAETERQLVVPYWQTTAWPPGLSEKVLKDTEGSWATVARHVAFMAQNMPRRIAKTDAQHATAVVAMAIARFRTKSGRLPKNLAELVPEYLDAVPLDPFDGKPIRYKQSDRGFTVYSIGPDMVDDGGSPLDEKTEKGDVLFNSL